MRNKATTSADEELVASGEAGVFIETLLAETPGCEGAFKRATRTAADRADLELRSPAAIWASELATVLHRAADVLACANTKTEDRKWTTEAVHRTKVAFGPFFDSAESEMQVKSYTRYIRLCSFMQALDECARVAVANDDRDYIAACTSIIREITRESDPRVPALSVDVAMAAVAAWRGPRKRWKPILRAFRALGVDYRTTNALHAKVGEVRRQLRLR